MNCYICGKACKGPEGVIHPVDGFGFRHLHCDPQEHVQKLPKETKVGEADGGMENAMYRETKDGDVELTEYGQLITARNAAALAKARKAAAAKSGGDK